MEPLRKWVKEMGEEITGSEGGGCGKELRIRALGSEILVRDRVGLAGSKG